MSAAQPDGTSSFPPPAVEGYCFRCKTRKAMRDPVMTRLANNKWAFAGTCVTCGTKMYKISAATPAKGGGV